MYEDSGSRIRRDNYGYDSNNPRNTNKHEYRQGRSISPNRRRNSRESNSRGRERSRSPREFNDRIYDDFAARDYNDSYEGSASDQGYRGDERDRPSRDFREGYEGDNRGNRDNRGSRERRGGGQHRDFRNDSSSSRETHRESRDNVRDNRDERDNARDNRDDYRDNRDTRDTRDTRDGGGRGYRDNNNRDNNRDHRDNDRDDDRDFRDNDRDNRGYRENSRENNSGDNYRNNDQDDNRGHRDNERDNNRDNKYNNRDNRQNNRDSRDRHHRDDEHEGADRRRSGPRENERDEDYSRPEPLTSPSSTIILQNIGLDCTEEKIESQLKHYCLEFRSIVVIRDRDSGENKGFAFVDFYDTITAEKWMKLTNREIQIDGKFILLNYSKSKKNESSNIPDWNCIKCNVLNFGSRKRRVDYSCYQCGALQTETDATQKDSNSVTVNRDLPTGEVVKVEPCNVLMVRGMDFSTTEEMIRTAIGPLTTHPIYDVRLIRDKVTDMSRGFAFIEMGTLEHARELLEIVEKSDPPFQIAGRRITIGYARHGYNMPTTAAAKKGKTLKQTTAENALGQASSARATADYSQGGSDTYGGNFTNAAAVALSTANAGVAAPAAQSSYTYDPTSGYYYDTSTGLYYDPNTGYYYNSTKAKWLFWNGSRYQEVNEDGTPVTSTTAVSVVNAQITATPVSVTATVEAAVATTVNVVAATATVAVVPTMEISVPPIPKIKDAVEMSFQKPKTARKIAKDMERWAKKMNTATEARKIAVKAAQDELKLLAQNEEELRQQILQEVNVTSIVANQIAALPKELGIRSLFVPENEEEGSVLKLGAALSVPPSKKPRKTASVIAADIPEDDDFIDESKFVDVTKMACLLCKRQFPSKDVLTKHLQLSQLHRDNLEKYKTSKQGT